MWTGLRVGAATSAAVALTACSLLGPRMPDVSICGEFEVVATNEQDVSSDILEQTRTILENRVNATGVAEPLSFASPSTN